MKLPFLVKKEVKTEEEEATEDRTEELESPGEVEVEDISSKDVLLIEAEDEVNHPEVVKSLKMLKEATQGHLKAYNKLIEAIPSLTNTEVKKVTAAVPKPEIGIPHSILEVFNEYGDVNFRLMLTLGLHLF